ncbi:hypothetical protein I5M27_10730 [Adhaeribacter sp. BT258]|uniref:Secreted protein n=1 Tax=Adhaeribacter terrigena TaxID=2793070 RepID=A0ABS1C2U8_9BACT|nr:hypothetical protein [Adhaeribacter terrigena]MBK0403461.1 hypothetical protein [Adhaeribacter terrigena]
MKFTSQFLVIASAVFMLACSQENNNTTTETANADDITSATIPPATTPDTTADAMQQMAEMAVGGQPQQATAPVAAGMNPPHGQPGHRCDVEVGAPLSGAPKANATANNNNPVINPVPTTAPPANNTVSPVFTAPATQPTSQPTVAGMNPPHGQPGHDCAIPVGAPLKK